MSEPISGADAPKYGQVQAHGNVNNATATIGKPIPAHECACPKCSRHQAYADGQPATCIYCNAPLK